jgi:hypothetical protein
MQCCTAQQKGWQAQHSANSSAAISKKLYSAAVRIDGMS